MDFLLMIEMKRQKCISLEGKQIFPILDTERVCALLKLRETSNMNQPCFHQTAVLAQNYKITPYYQ